METAKKSSKSPSHSYEGDRTLDENILDFTKARFEDAVAYKRRQLIRHIKSAIDTLQCELVSIEAGRNPNSLGILQFEGVSIDRLCGELVTAAEANKSFLWMLERMREEQAPTT